MDEEDDVWCVFCLRWVQRPLDDHLPYCEARMEEERRKSERPRRA